MSFILNKQNGIQRFNNSKYKTTIKEDISNYTFYISLLGKKNWIILLPNLIVALIKGIAPSIVLILTRQVYSVLTADATNAVSEFMVIVPSIIAIYLIKIVLDFFSFIGGQFSVFSGEKLSAVIEDKIISQYQKIEIGCYDSPKVQKIISLASSSRFLASGAIFNILFKWISTTITLISLCFTMPIKYAWVFSFSLLGAVLAYYGSKRNTIFKQAYSEEMELPNRKKNYFRSNSTDLDTVAESKIFNYDYFSGKYYNSRSELNNKELEINIRTHKWESFFLGLMDVVLKIPYLIIAYLTCAHYLDFGNFIVIAGAASSMATCLFWGYMYPYENMKKISRDISFLNSIFKLPIEKSGNKTIVSANDYPADKPIISFKNVTFSYDTNNVLNDFFLDIVKGKKYAIVGENGTGKTTIIKLLLKFYTPQKGTIMYLGNDIKEYNNIEYRNLFGVMFQNYNKYSLSIYDNIFLGRNDSCGDILKSQTSELIDIMGLNDILVDENGISSNNLTRLFDNSGIEMSEGQWQKIALIRAIVKIIGNQNGILILDEPTASFDIESERRFLDWLFNDFKRTTIIVTHQLSIAERCDNIILIEEGIVKENGSPEILKDIPNGKYRGMFEKQGFRYT